VACRCGVPKRRWRRQARVLNLRAVGAALADDQGVERAKCSAFPGEDEDVSCGALTGPVAFG
jgi:hypothetical protein